MATNRLFETPRKYEWIVDDGGATWARTEPNYVESMNWHAKVERTTVTRTSDEFVTKIAREVIDYMSPILRHGYPPFSWNGEVVQERVWQIVDFGERTPVTSESLAPYIRNYVRGCELSNADVRAIGKRMVELLDREAIEKFCEDVENTYGKEEVENLRTLFEVYVVNVEEGFPMREMVLAESEDVAKMKAVATMEIDLDTIEDYDFFIDEIGKVRKPSK